MIKQIKKLGKLLSIASILAFAPSIAFAATPTVTEVLNNISNLFKTILPLLISFGVIYLVYGIVMYVIADEEEAKTKGREKIVFGIIGLAVIISIWGLVGILNKTLGLGGATGLAGENAPTAITKLVSVADDGSGCGQVRGQNLPGVLKYFTCIIGSSVIPLLFAIAVVTFVWGTIKFFFIEADEKREEGKQFMLWGIIALAVMISVWGLVGILGKTFGVDTGVLPTVKPPQSN